MKNRSTGRLGRLFNAVIPECFYRGSQPLENTTRFPITTFGNDVERGHISGFTLIELLVVVLIIGILSAIALPQYQAAVYKARVAELFINLKTAREAADVYYLANGVRPTSWTELDIQLPSAFLTIDPGNSAEGGKAVLPNGNFYILDQDGYIEAALKDEMLSISSAYPEAHLWPGCRYLCRAYLKDKALAQACLSLGGKYQGEQSGVKRAVYCIE